MIPTEGKHVVVIHTQVMVIISFLLKWQYDFRLIKCILSSFYSRNLVVEPKLVENEEQ